MEDSFGKYLRLFGSLFFLVIGAIVGLILLLLGIKLVFGLLSYIPWINFVYTSFIVLLPAVLFIAVYIYYIKRTKRHPSTAARYISYILLAAALICWIIFLSLDLVLLIKHASAEIGTYHSYDMIFLISNIAMIFVVGIIQALAMPREKDWMERNVP